jgi:hypothetical protein
MPITHIYTHTNVQVEEVFEEATDYDDYFSDSEDCTSDYECY